MLFGGRSGEHEISLRSALTVMSAMDPGRYEIVPIGIARDGRWFLRPDAIAALKLAAPKLRALGHRGIPVSLPAPSGTAPSLSASKRPTATPCRVRRNRPACFQGGST